MIPFSPDILYNKIRQQIAFIVNNVDPNWTSYEKRNILSLDDYVIMNTSSGQEYGVIIGFDDNKVHVFIRILI